MGIPIRFSSIRPHWRGWVIVRRLAIVVCCLLVGWMAWREALTRQLEQLGEQARHRAEFYRFNLESLLSRNASLPRVIALEDRLKNLLRAPGDAAARNEANDYLLKVGESADINSTYVMDAAGLTLAASNHLLPSSFVGHNYGFRPYFIDAMRRGLGIFYGVGATTGVPGYFMTSPVEDGGGKIGAVTVKISLEDFEAAMIRSGDKVFLADARGIVFLSSVPAWKYHSLMPLDEATRREIAATRQYGDWPLPPLGIAPPAPDVARPVRLALPDEAPRDFLVQSVRTGPLDWMILLLSETRQERQNALVAGIAAGLTMAVLLLTATYFRLRFLRYQERRQAAEALRRAHDELERRIAERTADLRATNVSLEERIETLKTAESILRETRDSAVQAGKLAVLGQMAAGISHEVNQPLTALLTFADNAADMLGRGRVEEVQENLGLIRQMAVRMAHIVGEIKNFARQPSAERSVVDVAAVVDQALMLVEARRKRAEAEIDTAGVPPGLNAVADAQRLEQVLVNLLLNALDAVAKSDARRVAVVAGRSGNRIWIAVRDSGPGIAEAAAPRLFEPFYTTKGAGQGLGLGLAISRMIAAELGGRLEARNLAEGGAEFTMTLEAAKAV
jgi:two-component system C4-dicarboxylate transport sensor histidine kinase DctB